MVAGWPVGLWWSGWVSGFEGFSRQSLLGICAAQAERLARYERQVTEQARVIAEQQQRLDEQATQIAALTAEVARLRRRLSRHSGNSSLPPSTDGTIPGQALPDPPAKPPAARRRGGQPGAAGRTLSWTQTPDQVIDHHPCGACGGCGADLADAIPDGVVRAGQVTDVPLLAPTVTAPCVYGPNLRALATYLLVTHAIPVNRVRAVLADVVGAAVSPGFVHGLLRATATRLADPVEAI